MTEHDAVQWLQAEVQKRLGPWEGVDRKGNPEAKEPLQTCIMVMPNTALALLSAAQRGMEVADE